MKWKSFIDLFKGAVIDKLRVTKKQMLHHLKSCLTGDAGKLLQPITITDGNSDITIEVLKIRYDNKRFILQFFLDDIFSSNH